MPSDRQIIETDKAWLRREYADTVDGLASLKAYATTLATSDPQDIQLTSGAFEGGSAGAALTNKRELRRIAVEELIAERDPDFVAPAPLPRRSLGSTVRLGV